MASVRHLGLFPFCIANEFPEDSFARTLFPIGVELERVLKWFWRVKKWKAVYTIDGVYSNEVIFWNNSVSTFVVNPASIDYYETLNPETEKDLVCKNGTNYAEYFGVGPYPASGFFFVLFHFRSVVRQGDLYYPLFICQALTTGAYLISSAKTIPEATPMSIVFDGITVPAFISRAGSATAVSGSLSISIHEYWPYDPNDGGGPIYDSTTGAQLREF